MSPAQCPKCFKIMKSAKQLKAHLRRKNPCDKVCPICNDRFPNQRAFNTHRKTHMKSAELIEPITSVEPTVPVSNEIERKRIPVTLKGLGLQLSVLSPAKTTASPVEQLIKNVLFALQDFDVEQISSMRERVTASDGKIVYEQISYKRTTIRASEIEKLLNPVFLMTTLGILGHKADIPWMMQQVLYYVHSQQTRPQFRSLRRTDQSRDIISMYTRSDPQANAVWLKVPFKHAQSTLNSHARRLTLFLVQAGMNAVEAQYWKSKMCVVLRMSDDTQEMILYRVKDKLIHQRMNKTDDFCDCFIEHLDEINSLLNFVNEQKGKVVTVINNQSLDVKIWKQFFNFTGTIVP